MTTDGLTPQEDEKLVALLSKWEGGQLSAPVFTRLAQMLPLATVETVILRNNKDVVETLLIPRPDDDTIWPGFYHVPGSALRTSDYHRKDINPVNGPFERIQKAELQCDFASEPTFVGCFHHLTKRGPEVVELYFTELARSRTMQLRYLWYPVDQLAKKDDFIQFQLERLFIAVNKYLSR